jgi:hypothetical protein
MTGDESGGEVVVLRGTITELRPSRGPHPHLKWLATLSVDSVVAGSFSEPTFPFHIHSPTRSGIAEGGRYVLHLTRTPAGEYLLGRIEPWTE